MEILHRVGGRATTTKKNNIIKYNYFFSSSSKPHYPFAISLFLLTALICSKIQKCLERVRKDASLARETF